MDQYLQSFLALPHWLLVFALWAVLSAPVNIFAIVMLYRLRKAEMSDRGFNEDDVRAIAHGQALIAYAEMGEARRAEDRLERVLM